MRITSGNYADSWSLPVSNINSSGGGGGILIFMIICNGIHMLKTNHTPIPIWTVKYELICWLLLSPATRLGKELQGLTWSRFCWCYSATSHIKSLPDASSNGPWDSDSFFTSSLNSFPPAFSSTDPGKEENKSCKFDHSWTLEEGLAQLVSAFCAGGPDFDFLGDTTNPSFDFFLSM